MMLWYISWNSNCAQSWLEEQHGNIGV